MGIEEEVYKRSDISTGKISVDTAVLLLKKLGVVEDNEDILRASRHEVYQQTFRAAKDIEFEFDLSLLSLNSRQGGSGCRQDVELSGCQLLGLGDGGEMLHQECEGVC